MKHQKKKANTHSILFSFFLRRVSAIIQNITILSFIIYVINGLQTCPSSKNCYFREKLPPYLQFFLKPPPPLPQFSPETYPTPTCIFVPPKPTLPYLHPAPPYLLKNGVSIIEF